MSKLGCRHKVHRNRKYTEEQRREIGRAAARQLIVRDRGRVFDAYGNKCNCCGETERKFLCLDHVNNDGHRDKDRKRKHFYQKIVREGFPPDYQILCANCNHGKELNGGVCPHKGIVISGRPPRNLEQPGAVPLPIRQPQMSFLN